MFLKKQEGQSKKATKHPFVLKVSVSDNIGK